MKRKVRLLKTKIYDVLFILLLLAYGFPLFSNTTQLIE